MRIYTVTVPALCALKMWGQELLYLYHEEGEKIKHGNVFNTVFECA